MRAICWFMYLVVGWYNLPCKLGPRRRQPVTITQSLNLPKPYSFLRIFFLKILGTVKKTFEQKSMG